MKRIGRLHVLTDVVLQCRFSHVELARQAVNGGADTVQFRHKGGSTRWLIDTASEIREVCRTAEVCFIVNDRLDVAMASDADGVHLGQDDFPIPLARKILGKDRIIGGSASTLEEALRCQAEGADYVGFGPVFPTGSKDDAGPVSGLNGLRDAVQRLTLPVVAIGGVHDANIHDIMRAGAWGVAVISAVCCRESPEGAARDLQVLLSGCS
jgi:thiamine-phosphate pyrophosphorylase